MFESCLCWLISVSCGQTCTHHFLGVLIKPLVWFRRWQNSVWFNKVLMFYCGHFFKRHNHSFRKCLSFGQEMNRRWYKTLFRSNSIRTSLALKSWPNGSLCFTRKFKIKCCLFPTNSFILFSFWWHTVHLNSLRRNRLKNNIFGL